MLRDISKRPLTIKLSKHLAAHAASLYMVWFRLAGDRRVADVNGLGLIRFSSARGIKKGKGILKNFVAGVFSSGI